MNELLNSRYQLLKLLAVDGLEQTYLAIATHLPEQPKCIIRHLRLSNPNLKTLNFVLLLLNKKAESLQKLGKHDQIPQIIEYFEQGSNFYLVEAFIPGLSLNQILISGQPLPEERVVQLLQSILEILVVVHRWGMIHRCIQPSHLILREADGKPVLTGFGIFREISSQVGRSPQASPLNPAAVYRPDEQLRGQLQFNTDLYAVGVIGIQALTGLSATELLRLRTTAPQQLAEALERSQVTLNPTLAKILARMVHPSEQQRYALASAVLQDLTLLDTAAVNPQLSVPAAPAKPQSTRRLAVPVKAVTLSAIALGVLVAGGAFLVWKQVPQAIAARFQMQQAQGFMQQGQVEQAIELYSQVIQQRPSSAAYYHRGLAYLEQGNLQPAINDLTQTIQLDPEQPQAHYYRGNLRLQLGDRQGALADYSQSIQQQPDYVAAYVNRGTVRADMGDEQGAIADYTQAIQIEPNLVAAYVNRCLSRSNVQDHQGAIADCSYAISLQPNSVLAYQNRGLVRRRLGDIAGAIQDFNIAIRLNPDDPDPYYNRGLARLELGDQQGALADFSTTLRHAPDHVFAYYDRGLVRSALRDYQGAIADFQQSAKLCLDSGRRECYKDAQYQLQQLQASVPS